MGTMLRFVTGNRGVFFPPPYDHVFPEDLRLIARATGPLAAAVGVRGGEGGGFDMSVRAFVGVVVFAAGTAVSLGTAVAADIPPPPAQTPVAPVAYAPAAIYNWT